MNITKKHIEDAGIEAISEYDLEDQYREMLDDCYPDCEIAGMTYSTSRALEDVDPIAFRCGYADYISSLLDDTLIEIDGEYYDKEAVDELEEELLEAEEE